jgi:3,4-dihydroxy-2-butanone 4-phosphate synthase
LRYAHAFSQEVGIYATRNGEEIQAPVLMLRGRQTDIAGNEGESEQATPLAKIAGKTARQGWCHFAYPERSGSTDAPIRSFAEYVQLRDQGKVSDLGTHYVRMLFDKERTSSL